MCVCGPTTQRLWCVGVWFCTTAGAHQTGGGGRSAHGSMPWPALYTAQLPPTGWGVAPVVVKHKPHCSPFPLVGTHGLTAEHVTPTSSVVSLHQRALTRFCGATAHPPTRRRRGRQLSPRTALLLWTVGACGCCEQCTHQVVSYITQLNIHGCCRYHVTALLCSPHNMCAPPPKRACSPTTHTVGECECCVCDTTTHWGVWVRLLCSATRHVHTTPPHRELVSVCVVVVALPHIGVECECSVCTDMPTSAVCPPTFSSPPNRQVHISQVAAAVASAEACHGPHSSLCKLPLQVGGRGQRVVKHKLYWLATSGWLTHTV